MEELIMSAVLIGLMAGDVATGYLAAVKNNEVSSSIMRQGLFKKTGTICVLLLALAIEHAGAMIGVSETVCSAIIGLVSAMIALMEITSILENACKLNPDLPIANLFAMFGVETNDQ